MAGMISAAWAQERPTAAGATPAATGDSAAPVDPTQPIKSVTVSGYRSSLALSANEKRDNIGLSDTVFSEDMGKFPDPNIADALARVPGVQVTRGSIDGEGLNVSIRGMGPAFTRVLLNGAPMASASAGSWGGNISANREVDMDFLPSELFRSASVYKSQQASLIEGGIAGTVNMRSVRPFDKSGFRTAFTLSGNYRDQQGQWGNTGSALISNTWNSASFGKFGVLGGVAWGNTKYKTDAFQTVDMRNLQLKSFQGTPGYTLNGTGGGSQSTPDTVPSGLPLSSLPSYAQAVLVPGKQIDAAMLLALNPGATLQQIDNGLMGRLGRHIVYQGERKRAGEVLSFQWQPNDKWDLYLDTVFAQKKNDMVSEGMNVGTRANTVIPIGMEFDRSDCSTGCTVTKATLANTFWSLEFRPMKEKTVFRSINPGFEFRPADKWTIDGHLNYTSSSFYRDMPTILLATGSANSVIQYDNTTPGQTPVYTGNLDINNPANFGWYQAGQGLSGLRMDLYERNNTTKGSRLNVNWGDSDFSLKVGGAYDDMERRYRSYSTADAWMNVACGNNVNTRLFQPNTQLRQPGCDGRSTPGPVTDAATAYPGYGTGSTTGAPPLAYLGSVVTNAAIPQYAHPGSNGFITADWDKFAKATDYQYFRDNIYKGFGNGSGGYIREVVSAAYVEANGRSEVFGGTLRYNAGVRYARTKQTIGNLSIGADPRNATLQNGGLYDNLGIWAYETTRYSNTLPSATLAYNITPSLIARASASKSVNRANPADLRQTTLTLGDQGARQGSITNPNLKPFQANNLDLGLEYYFTREAYVALSGFAKDLTSRPGSRIVTYSLAQLDTMFGTTIGLTDAQALAVAASGGRDKHLVEITEPFNIDSKLKIRGVEFTWQQPLDMLPVKGFGFTGNFTYAKQKDEAPNAPPVSGVPPRTNNFTLYYERNGLNARVSRQYTAAYVVNTSTGLNVPGGAYAYTTERKQVDLSVGANLKKLFNTYDVDLTLSVWNVGNAISQTYTQYSNAIFDEYKPGRSYTLSARTTF
ncbi:hypothetical protein ASF61_09600 [Duganella sp. Leaf126]|nr:hypothetical protein ASF61_09600 [Duganella sp. Leaf126]